MNALGILILLSGPALAIAWVVAEFKGQRRSRLILGILSMLVLTAVAALTTLILTSLNYNSTYGSAAKELLDATVEGIESGNNPAVLTELKRLQSEFTPTYENRAGFVPLVNETVHRLNTQNQPRP